MQDALDIELDEAMKNAHGAAGLIISLGSDLACERQELISSILPRVEQALPGAINRVHRSYALGIFAALKVSSYLSQSLLHLFAPGYSNRSTSLKLDEYQIQ